MFGTVNGPLATPALLLCCTTNGLPDWPESLDGQFVAGHHHGCGKQTSCSLPSSLGAGI